MTLPKHQTIILSPDSIESMLQPLRRGEPFTVVGGDENNHALWLTVVPQKGAMYSPAPYPRIKSSATS